MAYKNKEDAKKYMKEYSKEYRKNNKEKIRLKNEKLYKFHKDQGLCTNCGKNQVFENLTQCEELVKVLQTITFRGSTGL